MGCRRYRQGNLGAEGPDRAGRYHHAAELARRELRPDRDRGWAAVAVVVNALTVAELPVICVETRHMKALLTAQQINKTDRNDARGIAQMMRVGLFKPVHVKTLVAQEQRMLLTSRKLLQRKLLDLESDLRGTLRNFGLKVGAVSGGRYEARVHDLIAGFPRLAAIAEPLLKVRQVMRQ